MFNIKDVLVELVAITSLVGLCFSSHLTVKEGEALSLRIKNPGSTNITTFALLTIDEYNDLLVDGISSSHSNCSEEVSTIDGVDHSDQIMPSVLSESELSSLSYLDSAEEDDLGQNNKITPDCKANCTVEIHVEDDDMFENEEYFIMLINGRQECAVIVEIMDDDSVGFTWSTQQMCVVEDQGNITTLSIVKTGNNQNNITVGVEVMVTNTSNEAKQGIQFDLLHSLFVFDNETFNLSVPFMVHDGTVGNCPKQFYLSLHVENGTSHGHSNSVRIFILNSVKYINQPENMTVNLGDTITIPCERAWDQGSVRAVPNWYIKLHNGSVYNEDHLPPNHIRRRDELVVLIEDTVFNLTEYTCSYIINVPNPEMAQREINSTTGVLTIAFPLTTFNLRLHEDDSAFIRVGGLFYFQIVKQGGGDFSFNVSLNYTGPAAIHQTSVILNEVTNETTINASIPDHLVLYTKERVSISILEPIRVQHYHSDGNTLLITNVGDPLHFTVYANVFPIGLRANQGGLKVSSISGFKKFCAYICEQKTPDLDPAMNVKLDIGLNQDNHSWFKLSVESVTLTHDDLEVCFNVTFSQEVKLLDCQNDTKFSVFMEQSVDPAAEYNVTFCNRNVLVTVSQESCPTFTKIIVTVFVPSTVVLILVIITSIAFACYKRGRSLLIMCKTKIIHRRRSYTIQ